MVTANTSCILISGDNNGMEASQDTELFPNTLLEVVFGNFDIDVTILLTIFGEAP